MAWDHLGSARHGACRGGCEEGEGCHAWQEEKVCGAGCCCYSHCLRLLSNTFVSLIIRLIVVLIDCLSNRIESLIVKL